MIKKYLIQIMKMRVKYLNKKKANYLYIKTAKAESRF